MPTGDSFSETCVYTIAHTAALDAAFSRDRVATLVEGKRWAQAQRLLRVAEKSGRLVPLLFAAAESTDRLIYYGFLKNIILGAPGTAEPATTFSVFQLTPFPPPQPLKTTLIVSSTGHAIPASHIRPYVICRTPAFIPAEAQSAQGT